MGDEGGGGGVSVRAIGTDCTCPVAMRQSRRSLYVGVRWMRCTAEGAHLQASLAQEHLVKVSSGKPATYLLKVQTQEGRRGGEGIRLFS